MPLGGDGKLAVVGDAPIILIDLCPRYAGCAAHVQPDFLHGKAVLAPQPKLVGCHPMARGAGSHQRIARAVCDQIGSADVRFVDQLPLRAIVALQLRRRLRSVQPLKPLRGILGGNALLNRII